MTTWLIILVIAALGYFLVTVYLHDEDNFSKLTGYSYFDVRLNKRANVNHKFYKALQHTTDQHKLLLNVEIPQGEQKRKIDAIFIHESGIFVMDIQHQTGWIAGREFDAEWLNLKHGNQTEAFDNPVNENKRSVFALRELFPELSADLFESLIVFTDNCSFQKIELQSTNVEVIKTTELKKWRMSLAGELLSKAQIETIATALKPYEIQPIKQSKKQINPAV